MRIGILTFHCAHNYGAVLQTYALQEVLRAEGHEVEIIDYRPDYLVKPYKVIELNPIKENMPDFYAYIRYLLSRIVTLPVNRVRYNKFTKFINSRLQLSKEQYKQGDKISPEYDAYIFGSDQIWNTRITKGFDTVFLGNFQSKQEALKIVYAASMETKALSEEHKDEYTKYLTNFSSIAVRENSLVSLLQPLTNTPVCNVVDPTLLCSTDLFDAILPENKEREPYIVLYQVVRNTNSMRIAKEIAGFYNAQLIDLESCCLISDIGNRYIKCSPEEFLVLIKNALFVVTSSFHGTVFSILFKKPFICPLRQKGSARIESLLNDLKIEDRIVKDGENHYLELVEAQINYTEVDGRLEQMRQESLSFLLNALKAK